MGRTVAVTVFLILVCVSVAAPAPAATDRQAAESEFWSPEEFLQQEETSTGLLVPIESLAKGDRVGLLTKVGQDFEGIVFLLTEKFIVIDFSYSRQQLAGIVTFPKEDVALVVKLPELSKEDMERRLNERQRRAEAARGRLDMLDLSAPHTGVAQLKGTGSDEAQGPAAQQRLQMEYYEALVSEFPEEEGWGPERLTEIRRKYYVRHQPLTDAEWRFWQAYDLLSTARSAVEKQEERKKQEQQILLTLFPPEQNWNPARKKKIEERLASGQQLSAEEAGFLKNYDAWLEAVFSRQQESATPQPRPL